MDKEVKQFFFSLSHGQLEQILDQYGARYGEDTKQYALATFPKWRAGTTQMSGLVAARLFNLLPPIMPMDLKLRIVEGLWEKQGANRTDYVLVPPNMSPDRILAFVTDNFFSYVGSQTIPVSIKSRFDWLSGEDAQVAEQLFRHARAIQLRTKEAIAASIMNVTDRTAEANRDVIRAVTSTITVGQHSVSIKRSQWVEEPTIANALTFARGNEPERSWSAIGWIAFAIGIVILAYIISR